MSRDASEGGSSSLVTIPGPRPADRPPDNLPLQLTSFVGREREMAEVQRLLTLTDPGGCGKTRVALAVGHEPVEEFKDGYERDRLTAMSTERLKPPAMSRKPSTTEGGCTPRSDTSARSATRISGRRRWRSQKRPPYVVIPVRPRNNCASTEPPLAAWIAGSPAASFSACR
jgi:hypothetical protein